MSLFTMLFGPKTDYKKLYQNGGDLGKMGNFIRDQISRNPFNKELFEQYWLNRGDLTLSHGRFLDIVRSAIHEGTVTRSSNITLSNGNSGSAQ
ncbi:MAG: hypothetical protein GY816_03230 [Cytophagales bacterium]|nr:hypothetical protein [Cytophagales bacterium]